MERAFPANATALRRPLARLCRNLGFGVCEFPGGEDVHCFGVAVEMHWESMCLNVLLSSRDIRTHTVSLQATLI
jgi:hypothetical protein